MDQADRDIIRTNIGTLSDDMDFDSVSYFLYSKRIFEKGHIEAFATNRNQKKKNLELLLAIETRGPEAFRYLVEALLDAKQPFLAQKLGYSPEAHLGGPVQASTPHEPDWPSQNSNEDPCTSGRNDQVYKMSSKPKGVALIINNKKFTRKTMKERAGTEVDCENLKDIFEELGCSVTLSHNLTGAKMKRRIRELSTRDHSQYDCFILAILTHGREGVVYGTDGGVVKMEDVIALFNADRCPTLKGKPKLFFIQACRGGQNDKGVEASDGVGPTGDGLAMHDLEKEVRMLLQTVEVDSTDGLGSDKSKLPSQSDMLIGYSAVPGFTSRRNTKYGSWFVQGLTEVMDQHAKKEDLISMMTMVNDKVASCASKHDGYKQASVYVSTLRKKLYFFPRQ